MKTLNSFQGVVHLHFILFHYKKAEASEKHLVKADQQRAASQPQTAVLDQAEGRRVWSPRERRITFPLWLQQAAETQTLLLQILVSVKTGK